MSKVVTVAGKRAPVRPKVSAEQFDLIAYEVRADVTKDVEFLVLDCRKGFQRLEVCVLSAYCHSSTGREMNTTVLCLTRPGVSE